MPPRLSLSQTRQRRQCQIACLSPAPQRDHLGRQLVRRSDLDRHRRAQGDDHLPAAGVDAVLIPGEPEAKMRADRTKNGVPLPDDTWAAIVNTAREVGVSESSIQRATQ